MLWALASPARLPVRARSALEGAGNDVFVSAASIWEIAIKSALGKVEADVDQVARASVEAGFQELAVGFVHAARVASLPPHHRDPFDRLLVAQAVEDGLTLVSGDDALAVYGVQTLWH